MPFSNADQITPIINEIRRVRPEKMLDVGCGLGVYGLLCRIQLDLYDDENFYKTLAQEKEWRTRIDAIEGYKDYLKFIPDWVYNDIKIGNVLDVLPTIKDDRYDLVLALAIIEHLSKEEGIFFLKELKRVSKTIILSVPKDFHEQHVPDNPFETHKSHWTDTDLKDNGFNKFLPHWGAWVAIYDPSLSLEIVPPTITANRSNYNEELKTELEKLRNHIEVLDHKTNDILAIQKVTLDRLNVSTRIKSLKTRLLRMVR